MAMQRLRSTHILVRSLCLSLGLGIAATLLACTAEKQDTLERIREVQAKGQLQESVALLEDMIASGDQRGEVFYRYGRALSAMGRVGRAVWPLDAAIDDPEWAVFAAKELAAIAFTSRNFDLALQTLARLKALRTDEAGDEDLSMMLLEARTFLMTRRHYDEALEILLQVLELDPDNDEGLRLKAGALLGLKQFDEAFELIRESAELARIADPSAAPNQGEAYWCSVESSFQRESGEIEKAQATIEGCLKRFASSVALVNEAVKVYSVQKDVEAVLGVFRAAYEEEPENRAMRFPFVLQLRAMGRILEAEAILRTAIETHSEADEQNPNALATSWVDLAGLLVDQGRLEEGLDAYGEADLLLGDATSPDLLFSQAEVMLRAGRFKDALEIAERTPVEVHGPMIRGRVAFEQGDLDKALEELDAAALLWPDNAPIRYYLARTSEGLGQFERAVEEYRQAIRSDQGLGAARVRLARLHLAEGRVLHARAIMGIGASGGQTHSNVDAKLVDIEIQARTLGRADLRNIPVDPMRSEEEILALAVDSLSRGLIAQNGPEFAAKALGEIQEQAAGTLARLVFRARIDNLVTSENREQAEILARAAVKDRPNDVHARAALARSLSLEAASLEQARALLLGLIAERPKDVDALALLGHIDIRLDKPTRAIENFEAALAISSDDQNAMIGLSRALDLQGRRPDAISRLESFLAHDNPIDGPIALELAKRLDEGAENKDRRIVLGFRAVRFGAGQPALDFLTSIDAKVLPPKATDAVQLKARDRES